MDWITKEQVREYATTPERALDISIRHHQQIVDATEEQLATQNKPLNGLLCGLCQYYDTGHRGGCGLCPLGISDYPCAYDRSLYKKARHIYEAKPFDHKAFIKAETALLDQLKELQSGDKSMERKETKIVETLIEELSAATSKAEKAMKEAQLSAQAVPMEEFEVVSPTSDYCLRMKLIDNPDYAAEIRIYQGRYTDTFFHLSKETLKELHQKSGRLLATAKLKAAKT